MYEKPAIYLAKKTVFTLSIIWCFNMHIYMPYIWKQELYIAFNLQTVLMLLKHTICNGKYEA